MKRPIVLLMKLMETLFRPFRWVSSTLEEHYTGRLRGLVQAIFMIGVVIVIASPIIVYAGLLSLQLQPPYSYISFCLWFTFIGFILLGGVYVSYSQAERFIESLSKDFKWDIEKYSQEYLELLKRQNAKDTRESSP
jgi:hypothetical protein